jgi:TrmH family RNA methyltransferase
MIRKLRDKKYRHESGLFFLEGIRIVLEALEHKEQIHQLIVSRELLTNSKAIQAVDQAKEEGISVLDV